MPIAPIFEAIETGDINQIIAVVDAAFKKAAREASEPMRRAFGSSTGMAAGPPLNQTGGNMLIVKVEIWPGGFEEGKFEIGRLEAANLSACGEVSSYAIELSDSNGLAGGKPTVAFRLDGHLRADGAWPLIHKALTQAIENQLVPISSKR